MQPVRVSPDVLAETGAALDALADQLSAAIRVALGSSDGTGAGTGWSTDAAARDVIGAAGDRIAEITATIEAIGDSLRRAAYAYVGADHRGAHRQDAIA
jgi:hypothetical protein